MSLRQVFNALEGYGENVHQDVQLQWEIARWQAMYFVSPYTKKGKTIKAKDLIIFPWEKQDKIIKKSREEILEIEKKYNGRRQ